MGKKTTPRERLVATVALVTGKPLGVNAAWDGAKQFVAAMEGEPEKPVHCPCCEKLVVLCREHYQLTEPGKPCSQCREKA
jgi:hypothetical protein